MSQDEIHQDAAEIRALAEQAEVEAAEAEALAAAARARSRAMQLRRQAEAAEVHTREAAQKNGNASAAAHSAQARKVASGVDDRSANASDRAEPAEGAPRPAAAESPDETVGETQTDAATASGAKPAWRSRLRRPKWSTIAAWLAIVVSVAALAGSAYMIKEHREAGLRRQRAAEFAAAARQGVVTITSLDFHDAKTGVQRILDNATGSFKDDFLKTSDDFVKVVEQSKVVSQGTVQITGVDLNTMTQDSAVVLVAATQEVTNAAGAKQDPRTYRLIVTIARDRAQLKIAKIEFVP